jgi:hypothetical protein
MTTQLQVEVSELKVHACQVMVAHACDPSYSGGRDQLAEFEASSGK